MINKMQAINLRHGDELHYGQCLIVIGPRGGEKLTQERWRINGRCKTWKTRPAEFRVPIKLGLYDNHYLDHENAVGFHPACMCAPFHHCDKCNFEIPCPSCHERNEAARKEVTS